MGEIPAITDIRPMSWHVRFVPTADCTPAAIHEMTFAKRKDRLAAVFPKSDPKF
jgi:hypothetical protein